MLGGAACKTASIESGAFLRVKRFDAKRDRYLLETPGGAGGWVPASDLSTVDGKVDELPHAGWRKSATVSATTGGRGCR